LLFAILTFIKLIYNQRLGESHLFNTTRLREPIALVLEITDCMSHI